VVVRSRRSVEFHSGIRRIIRLGRASEAAWFMVLCTTSVTVKTHISVTTIVVGFSRFQPVDRKLRVVDAKAVAVGVSVGKQAPLQHLVSKKSHTLSDSWTLV